jgi:hypothetical protein
MMMDDGNLNQMMVMTTVLATKLLNGRVFLYGKLVVSSAS